MFRHDFSKYSPEREQRALVSSDLWDECDISEFLAGGTEATNSYELIRMCEDGVTPLKSEEYIFIDEQTCIGCALCAHAAPDTFKPTETGRYRTFKQNPSHKGVESAVASCPVSCMHAVDYDGLKELELERESSIALGRFRSAPMHVQRSEASR